MTRVIHRSRDRIRLRSGLSVWLRLTFWAAFVGFVLWACPTQRIAVRRTENPRVADLRVETRLLGFTLKERRIPGVSEALLEFPERSVRRHDRPVGTVRMRVSDTSRIAFETADGPERLTTVYTTGFDTHERVADTLNGFLQADRPAATLIPLPAPLILWAVAAFLGFVAFGGTFGTWCDCEIDRTRNLVRVSWADLPRASSTEYRLSDVAQFLVFQMGGTLHEDPNQSGGSYTLGAAFHDGDRATLTRQLSRSPSGRLMELAEILDAFRRGDGLPRISHQEGD